MPSLSPTSVPTWPMLSGVHLFSRGKTCVDMSSGASGLVVALLVTKSRILRAWVKDVRQGTLASRLTPLRRKVTSLGAQNILGADSEDAGGEREITGSGSDAFRVDVSSRDPLLSPQRRHGQSVCFTTPHPRHLLRCEHG